jgi:hypothetical protein
MLFGGFMKIWILILCSSIFPVCAFSYNWFIGGSVAFSIYNLNHRPQELEGHDTNTNIINFTISPEIGYKINNFDFGIKPIFQYEQWEDNNSVGPDAFKIGIGPFLRYNFLTLGRLSILGRLDVDYLYHNRIDIPNIFNYHRIDVKINPVFEYTLANRLSLYTNFGISGITYSYIHMPNFYQSTNSISAFLSTFFSLSDLKLGFYIAF